jgi:hypothetical protein
MRRMTFVASALFASTWLLAGSAMAMGHDSVMPQHGGLHWVRGGRNGFGHEQFRGFLFGFGAPARMPYNRAPYGGYWHPGYNGYGYGQNAYPDAGGLKLDIAGPNPNHAEVYANGEFVGTENQFRGIFHKLTLRPGDYTIQVRAKGYAPLTARVQIQRDKTITYKGRMEALA